jgi:ribonuclease Z
MKITFLGTSAAIPTSSRGLSSIAIQRGGELLLFDAGEGMQTNFMKARLGINRKMKLFVTHMHADHCVGILGLLQTMSLLGRTKKLHIYGEPKLSEFINQNIRIINFGLSFDLDIHVIYKEGLVVKESDYQVSCCRSLHSILSYSFCIEEFDRPGKFNVEKAIHLGIPKGELFHKLQNNQDILFNGINIKSEQIVGPKRKARKIGISGDTRPTTELERFFSDSDILIFESTYSQNNHENAVRTFHSTAIEAASLAKASRAHTLFLTHFSSRYKDPSVLLSEAKSIHDNVELAQDLKIIDVPYTQ